MIIEMKINMEQAGACDFIPGTAETLTETKWEIIKIGLFERGAMR